MIRRSLAGQTGLTALALAFCLGSCAAPPEQAAPREGIVIYHDAGTKGRPPITFVYTTDPQLAEEYQTSRVVVGTRSGGPLATENAGDILKRQLQSAGSPPPRRVPAEMFGSLWAQLDEAGLFLLAEHPGASPPGSTSWFAVESDGRKRIFARPLAGASIAELERWRDSKLVVILFQNQGTPR